MKIRKVFWFDHKPTDNNRGYIFGIEAIDDFPDYVRWFKTEALREKFIRCYRLGVEE